MTVQGVAECRLSLKYTGLTLQCTNIQEPFILMQQACGKMVEYLCQSDLLNKEVGAGYRYHS